MCCIKMYKQVHSGAEQFEAHYEFTSQVIKTTVTSEGVVKSELNKDTGAKHLTQGTDLTGSKKQATKNANKSL